VRIKVTAIAVIAATAKRDSLAIAILHNLRKLYLPSSSGFAAHINRHRFDRFLSITLE
jgi:hypothetical protein